MNDIRDTNVLADLAFSVATLVVTYVVIRGSKMLVHKTVALVKNAKASKEVEA